MKPNEPYAARDPQIEQYLAEHLPDSEDRIPIPMNPACEVCVIIPAYDEREYILLPLESLTHQNNVTPDQYEVIVVVNNPGDPGPHPEDTHQTGESFQKKWERWQQVVEKNRETLELIEYINSEDEVPTIPISEKEEEIIHKIRKWGLKVYAVDKSTRGKTLPEAEANVGGARNRGTAEAVERFYKQLGRNGILAHTDADTRLEENYISNLIKAFNSNRQLVGLAGIDEDILDNPRDSDMMREYMKGYMANKYGMLLHQIFVSNMNESVFFIGSAMATRAFETAIAGGIPQVAGGEDYALGKKMEEVGLTIMDPEVVTFPIIRLSPRTTTGKGKLILKYGNDEKENEMVKVRCVEAAYHIGEIYKKLNEAKKNQQISKQDLRKILLIYDKPILDEEDLTRLYQNLHQLNSYRPALLNKDLREIMQKICDKIDNMCRPQPIDKASMELINIYCLNGAIKGKFQAARDKMHQERKQDIAAIESVLDKIFREKKQNFDKPITSGQIAPLLENLRPQVNLLKKTYRQKRIAGLIAVCQSKEEALELIKLNYMKELVLPGQDPVFSVYFELQVLCRSLE